MTEHNPRATGYWYGCRVSFRTWAAVQSFINSREREAILVDSKPQLVDFTAQDASDVRERYPHSILRFQVAGDDVFSPAFLFAYRPPDKQLDLWM